MENSFNKNDIDLSVLIPSRNEMFLARTVEDILKNIRGKTEIIITLDGVWADPGIIDDPRVTIIYHNESIGQRAATNEACKLSKAKYVMKLDAHCALDEGFDVKMLEGMQKLELEGLHGEKYDHYTLIPTMYNLHAFDWVCFTCGWREYQGPTPDKCPKCGSRPQRETIWKPRLSRKSNFYRFDKTLHFQYWGSFGERPEAQGNLVPTMSAQGSCFMLSRKKYWELDICDEEYGSWGQQGVEVACKTWLSGGALVTNRSTWYSHMFRTRKGFSFPYPQSGTQIDHARERSRDIWLNNKWEKAIYSFEWLLEKFKPIPDWHEGIEATPSDAKSDENEITDDTTEVKKGIIFYTDNQLNVKLAHKVQKQLLKANFPIVSASLKPMTFGKNVHLPLQRGYLTMARQILAALEASDADIIFFAEHDVLYHPSHFKFTPERKDMYYYNTNVWRVRANDGHALWCDDLRQLSGLVAYRETLLEHFRKRMQIMEDLYKNEPDESKRNAYVRAMGFEPGTHGRPERVDDIKAEDYLSTFPNIDIRHEGNLTPSRWEKEQFRNQKYTKGWKESHVTQLDGWEQLDGQFFVDSK